MTSNQSTTETRLRELLAQTRTHVAGSLAREIDAALAATPTKPSASKRDKGWRYKWNDEKKLMEFSNE